MLRVVLLLVAGAVSGMVGSAGGTTSLIAYPAMLAAGLTPLAANVTSAVAFLANWPGSALGGRPELSGQGPWLRRWSPLAGLASALGAGLLLVTPATAFNRIAPFLLALAAVALLAQPRISAWLARGDGTGAPRGVLPIGLGLCALYDGYWGAGAGIMTLSVLMITTGLRFAQANALKNMVLGIADAACCAVFLVFWPVDWAAAVPLGLGILLGSALGPAVTRRVPPAAARITSACIGLGLAVCLWAGVT
ncbi:sulfite exporter TauE/SafE family protein [Kitasatospora sp. NBC_01302]|uniref:sulfite exporter TauE/SafE family protein n=1 Tax=Kitasatospora sp. NBC_01302 TaxID=2903575 RepID=UPI002E0F14E3|nr:sulfite exporter TauE/SafE family protein [Kitasatospora sp. NBC_01302]